MFDPWSSQFRSITVQVLETFPETCGVNLTGIGSIPFYSARRCQSIFLCRCFGQAGLGPWGEAISGLTAKCSQNLNGFLGDMD